MAGCVPAKTREMLARSLLIPHFEYCCTVFSYGLNYVSRRLLTSALHAIVRYVYAVRRRDEVEPHVVRFLGGPLEVYFRFRAMAFLHKLTSFRTPGYLSELLEYGGSERTSQLVVPRCGRRFKNSLFGRGVMEWNLLPAMVRRRSSYELFRRDYMQLPQ